MLPLFFYLFYFIQAYIECLKIIYITRLVPLLFSSKFPLGRRPPLGPGVLSRMRRKRRPYILACISGIHGRILVIFSILQIPYAYSLCFILLTFVHGHCGKNYSDFNVVKWSEILATNCALTTNQIEKALIHHVSLYVYF
jgi:hypothetical protein